VEDIAMEGKIAHEEHFSTPDEFVWAVPSSGGELNNGYYESSSDL
jgi:hypothetical protein